MIRFSIQNPFPHIIEQFWNGDLTKRSIYVDFIPFGLSMGNDVFHSQKVELWSRSKNKKNWEDGLGPKLINT